MAELATSGWRRPLRRTLTGLLAAFVAMTTCMVVLLARPSGADQVSSLQSEATSVAQQLVHAELVVDADQQQAAAANARVAAAQVALATTNHQIAADEESIARRQSEIRRQAITDYMGAGEQVPASGAFLFSGNLNRAQATNEYVNIATGHITIALDQLRTAETDLRNSRATLGRQQQAADAAQASAEADLGGARSAASRLQGLQSRIQGQLAVAVSAAQARQAEQVRSSLVSYKPSPVVSMPAGAPTTTRPSVPTVGTTPAPPAGGNLSDPFLPPFLACVVQAESGGNYSIVSANGLYMGAFQFAQGTWNSAAAAAGLGYLVGVPPNDASRAAQDTVAVVLYHLDGERPWLGDRCSG